MHIATLGDQRVAVKVQHPNLTERLDIDMEVLRWVADWAGDRVKQTVDQFSCNFQAQLDFRDEAKNLNTFNERFSGMFWRSLVSFPQPIEGLVSEHVLVETFEEGESVANFLGRVIDDNDDDSFSKVDANSQNDSSSLSSKKNKNINISSSTSSSSSSSSNNNDDIKRRNYGATSLTGAEKDLLIRKQVAQCGMQAFLKMLIWDNFIHADLHPGNGTSYFVPF